MTAYREGRINLQSLLISTLNGSGQIHAPAALATGRELWHTWNRRLGWPQSWSGHNGEKKDRLPLLGFESRTVQTIAYSPYCLFTIKAVFSL